MAKKNQLTKSDYLSMEEYQKLLKKLHADKKYLWELYARLSFYTAMRASDVLSLTWADVLNKTSIVKVEKKTQKTRKIDLSAESQAHIMALYITLKQPNPNKLIFQSPVTGLPYTIQYINRIIKTWKTKYNIKIDHFSTHTFRKTFGRWVYDQDKDKSRALILLNQIFKHTSIEITKIYICINDDEIKSIFNSIKI